MTMMDPNQVRKVVRYTTWRKVQRYLDPVIRSAKSENVKNFILHHPILFLLMRIRRLEKENRCLIREKQSKGPQNERGTKKAGD